MIFFSSYIGVDIIIFIFCVFIGYSIIFEDEKITFDTGIKCVIIEKRTIANKKLKWKEIKKINFSDIKDITVMEQYDNEGGITRYHTELIFVDGSKKMLPDGNFESAKNSAIKICKVIGIKGNYIDGNKNLTVLINIQCPVPDCAVRKSTYRGLARHIAMVGNNNINNLHTQYRKSKGILNPWKTVEEVTRITDEIMRIEGWEGKEELD